MSSILVTQIQALLARYAGSNDPDIQAMIASFENALAKTKAALPAITVVVVNDLTDGIPGAPLIQGAFDPLVKGGVTLAEDALWNLFDHGLTQAQKVNAAPAVPPVHPS